MALNFKIVKAINEPDNERCYKCGGKATHKVEKEKEVILTCGKQVCVMEAIKK